MSTLKTSPEEEAAAEERHAARWLNESLAAQISQLQRALEDLLDLDLEITQYHFTHNFSQPNIWRADFLDLGEQGLCLEKQGDSEATGDCLRNCSAFVLQQASIGPALYNAAFRSTAADGRLETTRSAALGAASSLELLPQFSRLANATSPMSTWSMQAGGGSGWGFQVACGDSVLLSSGGGGGGGFYLSTATQRLSFGAGGGAGMQIFVNQSTFSTGGGGGCGLDHANQEEILCGFQADRDSAPENGKDTGQVGQIYNLSQSIAMLNAQLSSCASPITVMGGGGGGGGTGACCWPFRIGYGFSFELHPPDEQQDATTHHLSSSLLSTERRNTSAAFASSAGSDADVQEGGVVGAIFMQASRQCEDPRDWCCRILYAQNVVLSCVAANASETNSFPATEPTPDLLCQRVLNQLDTVAWLLRAPHPEGCSPTNTSQGSLSTLHSISHGLPESGHSSFPNLEDVGNNGQISEEQEEVALTLFSLPNPIWRNESLPASYPVHIHLPCNFSQDDRNNLLSFACHLRERMANASSDAADLCPIPAESCWQCVALAQNGTLELDRQGSRTVSDPLLRAWQPQWTRGEAEAAFRWTLQDMVCSVSIVLLLWMIGTAVRKLIQAQAVNRASFTSVPCSESSSESEKDVEDQFILPTESMARWAK